MLGEDGFGLEMRFVFHVSFGDDALAFAEQVGQHALIDHADMRFAVSDVKIDAAILTMFEATGFNQPAQANQLFRIDMVLRHIGRAIKKYEVIAEGAQGQQGGNA